MAEKDKNKSGNTLWPTRDHERKPRPNSGVDTSRLRDQKVFDPYKAPAKVTRPPKDEGK